MVEKHELRGIASLPQEVYDEITLSFASDDLEVKVRNGRLMRLRLVSVPFDRSASRILFSAVCLDTSRLCKKAQLLHVQSPSSIKFVFTSDLCRFIRYLTVCLSSEIQQWNSRTVERTYENLSRCLIRLPSLQYFEIIPTICDNAHLQVDTMLRALRRAHRYLPGLVGLKISVPEILFQEPPPRLWRLEDVLRRYLPQLQHVDIDFGTWTYQDQDNHLDSTFLPLFCLGPGLRSIYLDGVGRSANHEYRSQELKPARWLHPDAPIEHIRLLRITAPYEVLAIIFRYKGRLVSLEIIDVVLSTGKWGEFFRKLREFPLLSHLVLCRCSYFGDKILNDEDKESRQSAYRVAEQRKKDLLPGKVRKIESRPLARIDKYDIHLR